MQKAMNFCLLLKIKAKILEKAKNLSGKYSLLDHAKQSATDAFKTASKRAIQKTTATSDLIHNKIANKITKVSKKIYNRIIQRQLQMKMIKKYLKKDMYLQKKRQEIIDDVSLK